MAAVNYYFIDAYHYSFILFVHLMTNVLIIICKDIFDNYCKYYVIITYLMKNKFDPKDISKTCLNRSSRFY